MPLAELLELPDDQLNVGRAVRIALELIRGASPALARQMSEVPNVQTAWEVALEDFSPADIRDAARLMVKRLARDGSMIPSAPLLASYCEEIVSDRRRTLAAIDRQVRLDAEAKAERDARPLTHAERSTLEATLERFSRSAAVNVATTTGGRSFRRKASELSEAECSAIRDRQRRELVG